MCDQWRDFAHFFADMGPAPEGCSLDRIDNDGNYEPGNCRWATSKEQAQNTRRNLYVTIDGDRICLSEACRRRGLNYRTVQSRINILGMTIEDALSLPHGCPNRGRRARGERASH